MASYYDNAIEAKCAAGPGLDVRISLKQDLVNQKTRAEAEVARLTELIRLLESNPETDRILELLGKSYR